MFWSKQQTWSYHDLSALWALSKNGLSANDIAYRLGKTEDAVMEKVQQLGIILKEKNPTRLS
jgi:hypothetical protein